ncbi:hypothetical protein O9993_17765 [Vibrio lentus]|nr:hypothetical protein [Vibrio lentus]
MRQVVQLLAVVLVTTDQQKQHFAKANELWRFQVERVGETSFCYV